MVDSLIHKGMYMKEIGRMIWLMDTGSSEIQKAINMRDNGNRIVSRGSEQRFGHQITQGMQETLNTAKKMVMGATNGAMAATTMGVLRMVFLRAKDLTSMQTSRKLMLVSLDEE